LLSAVTQFGCRKPSTIPPQQVYADAELKFQRGELDQALLIVDRAVKSHSNQTPEWIWRFRVLEAEILVWRGSPQDSHNRKE